MVPLAMTTTLVLGAEQAEDGNRKGGERWPGPSQGYNQHQVPVVMTPHFHARLSSSPLRLLFLSPGHGLLPSHSPL